MEDDYEHVDGSLFYTVENCPGLGCDRALFDTQLAGCRCRVCRDDCPCSDVSAAAADGAAGGAAGGGGESIDVAAVARPLVECNSACACGAECARRVVQRGPRPGLRVFDAGPRGLGLRTERPIPRGAFVCCYAGEVVGVAEAARRFAAQRRHNYILAVREHCAGRVAATYIDATRVCNVGHYANHSCRPSMALRPVRVDSAVPHAALFAARDIAAGQELTFSYGPPPPPPPPPPAAAAAAGQPCLCGEPECVGVLPSDAAVAEEAAADAVSESEAAPQGASPSDRPPGTGSEEDGRPRPGAPVSRGAN